MTVKVDWKPIETAPKDGTLIRVRFLRDWVFERSDGKSQDWQTLAYYIGWRVGNPWGWVNTVGQSFLWPPTHWSEV